jgi:hypothetical protein
MNISLTSIVIAIIVIVILFHIQSEVSRLALPCDCLEGYTCACVNGGNCMDGCYLDNGTLVYTSAHCQTQKCVKVNKT